MSDSNPDVALIGASGPTGRPLVKALIERGVGLRVLVHSAHRMQDFPELNDFAVVELDDLASLTVGLRGASVAHYIPPTYSASEERFGANVIAAAVAAGVPRLVYHSVLHAPTPQMPHHLRKSRVELALRESPLDWTIVQPAMYTQTPYAFLSSDRSTLTPGFDTRRPFTPLDVVDLSEVVARILTEDGHAFATYELAGAERLTFEDMAYAIGQAVGKSVTAQKIDPALVAAQAAARGFGSQAVDELVRMMAHYDAHGLVGNSNVLRMLLGREPTSFADAVTRDLGTGTTAATVSSKAS